MKQTALDKIAHWASNVRLEDIPKRVREQAINQIFSILAAVYSGWDSDLGRPIERAFPVPEQGSARIVPSGTGTSPSHAAMLMASWSMVLDFDDVMLGGHTGHSSVLVPLSLRSEGKTSGADLILAQIVANEVAARINMVCALGSVRGQMATHLHLLGAAAARAKMERLDEQTFAAALEFAVSYPAKALYPAFLGSDAKVLCAALPIRVGIEAVDAVKAGLVAGADRLDGPRGFFVAMSKAPVREFLEGLGERWHTETNSFKIYPVCGYLCSVLDATLDLVRRHDISPEDVAAVEVWASLFTVAMDQHSRPYLDGPRSRISTLTFSTPFTVASAIHARKFGPDQLKREWIENPNVWELADRVRVRHDVDLTLEALRADIPIGAALRRAEWWQAVAFGWSAAATAFGRIGRWYRPESLHLLAGLVGFTGDRQPLSLERSTKPIGARVEIALANGQRLHCTAHVPCAFAGASRAEGDQRVRELMREKFMSNAGRVIGTQRARSAAGLIDDVENLSSAGVTRMLEFLCLGASSPRVEDEAAVVGKVR